MHAAGCRECAHERQLAGGGERRAGGARRRAGAWCGVAAATWRPTRSQATGQESSLPADYPVKAAGALERVRAVVRDVARLSEEKGRVERENAALKGPPAITARPPAALYAC
jgi:hypothetical protein